MDNSKLRILQWNINSVYSKSAELQAIIELGQYDVIMLQEARLTKRNAHLHRIPGYHNFVAYGDIISHKDDNQNRPLKKRGLLTAIKSNIPAERVQSPYHEDIEALVVKITMPSGIYELHNIYHSQRNGVKPEIKPPAKGQAIYCGDYNARTTTWGDRETHPRGLELEDTYHSLPGIEILNDGEYTTIHDTVLDMSFATKPLNTKCRWRVNRDILSDVHYGIEIDIGMAKYCDRDRFQPRFKLDTADWPAFTQELEHLCAEYSTKDKPIETIALDLNALVMAAADKTIKKTKYCNTPWRCWFWNENCTLARRNYSRALTQFRSGQFNRDASMAILDDARLTLKACYDAAKQEAWSKLCQDITISSNDAKSWQRLKNIHGTYTPRLVPNPADKAEALADEFAARTSKDNLPGIVRNTVTAFHTYRQRNIAQALAMDDPVNNAPYTIHELNTVLKVKRKTAPGADGVHLLMLHYAGPIARKLMLELFNEIHLNRQLPNCWREAEQVAIPKPGKRDAYRPISLLSCISKTMERMVLNRAMPIAKPKMEETLFGFIPNRGTTDGLMLLTELISKKHGSTGNKHALAAFIDLEKAFELADPIVVIDEAAKLGIKGHLLAYMHHYLQNRKGCVKMQGAKSTMKDFDLGTPQGSCISPFLFNIIMNRLISNKTDPHQLPYKTYPSQVTLISYADDIAMVSYEARNIDKHVQKALSALDDNCSLLGLKISVDKTKIMRFLIGKDPPNTTPFTLQGTPLEQVPT